MSSFINRILTRHSEQKNIIQPRLPGRFENMYGNHPADTSSANDDWKAGSINIISDEKDSTEKNSDYQNPRFAHVAHPENKRNHTNDTALLNDNSETTNSDIFFLQKEKTGTQNPGTSLDVISAQPDDDRMNSIKHQSQIYKPVHSLSLNDSKDAGTMNEINKTENRITITDIPEKKATLSFVAGKASSHDEDRDVNKEFVLPFSSQEAVYGFPYQQNHNALPELPAENKPDLQRVIQVHIGRIEIQAINQLSNNAPHKSNHKKQPAMSLDDYLKKRNTAQ